MLAELDTAAGPLPPYDVCVVGSGPAGIVLARELGAAGVRVALLESGRLRTSAHGDALRACESDGLFIKDWSRERVFGGASTTWAGLSSPLDAIDLAPRPWARLGGWPITRDELLPLWAEASRTYRFAPLALYDDSSSFAALRPRGDAQPKWERIVEKTFLAAGEPQDFGREHRAALEAARVDVWLDATVLRLEGSAAKVAHALVRSASGREERVRARAFVLATGGIENARLLLLSRTPWSAGLGNEHDQVGRCFMNHPKSYAGVLHFARPVRKLPYYFGCLHEGWAGYAGMKLGDDVQRELGLLNSYVRLEPLFPWTDSEGVEALVHFAKKSGSLLRRWKSGAKGEVVELRDYSETGDDSELQNARRSVLAEMGLALKIVGDAPRVTSYAWHRLRRRARPIVRRARLRNFLEMEPHPENRVTLADARDAFGSPLPRVSHRCTALDKRSIVALHAELAREVERNGLGRLESDLERADPWPIDQDASHHMGTTRMGLDPRSSVVDPQLRVHSASNVWCAGASTFPTSGCANPTYTIAALSIRLARHLARELPSLPEPART